MIADNPNKLTCLRDALTKRRKEVSDHELTYDRSEKWTEEESEKWIIEDLRLRQEAHKAWTKLQEIGEEN